MRSGHLGRGRAWLVWTLLCTGMCVTSVRAQSPVVCTAFNDAELLARIRGQTRDLPIVLISAASADVSHPSARQLQAIASEHEADFVVSVDHEPDGSRNVYVFDARASELRVRTAPAPDRKHRFARSAATETVALIVRGELSDALAARPSQRATAAKEASAAPPGRAEPANTPAREPSQSTTSQPVARATNTKTAQKSAVKREPSAREPEQTSEEEETPPELEAEPAAEPEAEAKANGGSSWLGPAQLALELAGRASIPIDGRYFFGAALSLRLSFDYVSVGVTGSSTLADRSEIQGLTLTLREHGVALDALAHLPLTAAVRLGLGAAGRWLFYRRTAQSADPEWNPEPADTSSTFAIGPQAELRWQLAQRLGVSIRIGLDVLLRPVSWRYRLDTNPRVPIELERQNRAEPWLSVGVYGSL